MKIQTVTGLSLLLIGCGQELEVDGEVIALGDELIREFESGYTSFENEITYIEMLIGNNEMEAANAALNHLLFSTNGTVIDELQQARINTLITLLEYGESERIVEYTADFTGIDAIAIAKDYYGNDEDIIYMYHEEPSYFGINEIGYYVALKSVSLMESDQNSDGIVLNLFVSSDGKIEVIE